MLSPLFIIREPRAVVVLAHVVVRDKAVNAADALKYCPVRIELEFAHVPVVTSSAFISPVASLAVQEPIISICHTSPVTLAKVNHVTSVSVALFVTVKSEPSLIAKSQ